MVKHFLEVISESTILLLILVKLVHRLPQFVVALRNFVEVIVLIVVKTSFLKSHFAVLHHLGTWCLEHYRHLDDTIRLLLNLDWYRGWSIKLLTLLE